MNCAVVFDVFGADGINARDVFEQVCSGGVCAGFSDAVWFGRRRGCNG